MKNFGYYADMWKNIREKTGIEDIDELVMVFLQLEQRKMTRVKARNICIAYSLTNCLMDGDVEVLTLTVMAFALTLRVLNAIEATLRIELFYHSIYIALL